MSNSSEFAALRGKAVLVTGADGFMGSHLTERLVKIGARVSVFVRGSSVTGTALNRLRNIGHLQDSIVSLLAGDIGSPDAMELIRKNAPQVIFHLAAEAYVPRSFDQPLEVVRSNVDGTLNVLQAARSLKDVERVVVTSSSEVYGPHPQAIREDFPMNPTSPYGASKAAADRIAYSYWTTYGLPVAIIRPFNTYGPRHTYDVVPKFIGLALRGEPLTVHGTGDQTRDLSYVDDTVRAFLTMGTHPAAVGKAVNFGTGKDVTINDVARLIVQVSGSSSPIVHTPARTSEVSKLQCDPSLASELFGWRSQIDIEEGLRRNVDWVREHAPS
jgi:NDP-hexose 4,6-dehydratase